MLRIYYELDLYEAGFSMVNAFRNFLSVSDEISETFKVQHLNFVNFYNRLLKMKSESSNQDAGFLQSEISKKDSVASKGWLIDKAKELALQK